MKATLSNTALRTLSTAAGDDVTKLRIGQHPKAFALKHFAARPAHHLYRRLIGLSKEYRSAVSRSHQLELFAEGLFAEVVFPLDFHWATLAQAWREFVASSVASLSQVLITACIRASGAAGLTNPVFTSPWRSLWRLRRWAWGDASLSFFLRHSLFNSSADNLLALRVEDLVLP